MTDTPPDPATAPSAEDDDPDPVDEWLQFARDDLRSARTLWADREIPPPIPCFHPWAVAGRYPGDVPEIPRELAGELIALAETVCSEREVRVAEVRRG
jgi:hypothetical protein